MEMASRVNVRIVRTETVKPEGGQAHEGGLYMSASDQLYGVQHNRTVFLYRRGPPGGEWVEKLKESLGLALAQFSPLAGRLGWVEGGRLEIVCNGKGAELAEAECDVEMSWFQDPADLDKVIALVPKVDYERPLEELPMLMLQLTRFPCGGLALGVSMSHMATDGQSAFHFFSEWARLARGEVMKEAPSLLYREMLRETKRRNKNGQELSDHVEYHVPPFMLGKEDAIEEWKKATVKVALPLMKEQLDALKKEASSTAASIGDGISRGFSRFEVVSAHIWRCLSKARGLVKEQPTILSFSINVRNHIRSIPLPRVTFGNMVIRMKAKSQVGDLISNNLGFVCGKVREAINTVDEDYVWSSFDLLEKQDDLSLFSNDSSKESKVPNKSKPYYGNPNVRVVSWLSMPIHGIDFGWGNYSDLIPVTRNVDGSIILLPMSGNDDGSIVVLSCLQVAYAEEFKKHFYQAINK